MCPGEAGEGQHLGLGVVHVEADLGDPGGELAADLFPAGATASWSSWAKMVRNTAATMSIWFFGTRARRLRAKWMLCRRRHNNSLSQCRKHLDEASFLMRNASIQQQLEEEFSRHHGN
jgi:hypothetical protein